MQKALLLCSSASLGHQLIPHFLEVKANFSQFPDGEWSVSLQSNVKNLEVLIFQTFEENFHDALFKLLIAVDAVKRAGASKITAILPYLPYNRQDRKFLPGTAIGAKLIAKLFEAAGIDEIVTFDLHAEQVEGFYELPLFTLNAFEVFIEEFKKLWVNPPVVVAPDLGSVKWCSKYAQALGTEFAIVNKQRIENAVEVSHFLGDVNGKDVLLADDLCSSAKTIVSAAKACHEKGAKRIFAAVTHGRFVEEAVKLIEESPIECLVTTDTLPLKNGAELCSKIRVVSLFPSLLKHLS